MYDVDLLVPNDSIRDAAGVLQSHGWVPDPPVSLRQLTQHLRHSEHGRAFVRGYGSIDLHWHVLHQDCTDFFDRKAWGMARPLRNSPTGTNLLALAPTEHLLHVCLHGVRGDSRANRIWALDARHILETAAADLDWKRLIDTVIERRLVAPVADALQFLATLTDRVPARHLERLANEPIHPVEVAEYRMTSGSVSSNDVRGRSAVDIMRAVRWRYERISLRVVDTEVRRSKFQGGVW
jgi:hypothetical protein